MPTIDGIFCQHLRRRLESDFPVLLSIIDFMGLRQKAVFSRRSAMEALRPLDPSSETQTMNLTACSAWHQKDSLHRMSLIDKESDASKALRLLIIGSRQKEIDL